MMNNVSQKIVSISPREAYEYLQENAVLVDIRPEYEICLRVFDVPKVIYLPYNIYKDKYSIIPKDIFLIVSDSVGNQSAIVVQFLIDQGYSSVASLTGGVVAWDRSGLPLLKDVEYEMIGGCACRLHPQKVK